MYVYVYVRGGGGKSVARGERTPVCNACTRTRTSTSETGSSQKSLFPDTRSSIVHTLRVVVGGGAGELWGRRLLGGVQRRRRTFVHAQSLSAVTRSFVFQGLGAAGFGKKMGRVGHTRNGIQRAAPAFPTHSLSLSFSSRKTTSPIAPGRREETALPVPFSTSILADPLRPPRFVPARRKDHWTKGRGASLWCSRQMRQGYRVPFWRYDSTAASKPGSFFFFFG